MDLIYTLDDIKTTAEWLLKNSKGATCLAFFGEMGTGKTTLINEICRKLGADGNFSSPTFSIINEYATIDKNTIYHIDLYRLKDEKEVIASGAEDCMYSGNYCFVEWPERASALFPAESVKCQLTVIDTYTRKLTINM